MRMKTMKGALMAGAMVLAGMTVAGGAAHAENGQKPQYGGALEIGTVYVTLSALSFDPMTVTISAAGATKQFAAPALTWDAGNDDLPGAAY